MTKTHTRLSTGAKTAVRLSAGARVGIAIAGVVQVAFAFLAFWDLAFRDADEVRGPKPAWIPVILVNWIGPLAYFSLGIRHRR
ncbi:PLDc N-terminal domain-containing protein [Microbacterium lushaniae]|uniref:Cardiolipin synthase N-terminal domain-containing protein n=1 Tax=Microbacterium lushaniae TaxID=2614639 RepID=A0A5J6L565_9MICO|nr:PLDc N-terminal domain-containing protein [Microbacterium lushaniae]QEW03607.1 hypothetical protein F6J85_11205 [Microbacterium lushaniae]